MLKSVQARSDPAAVPDLTDRPRIQNGAVHYYCLQDARDIAAFMSTLDDVR